MALSNHPHNRVVLLFDLDCFYAQCERVRLGLDIDVSLALLQWNSALAVTYPARKFGIKRGDGWDAVAEKSKNSCWAIHLKILERKTQDTSESQLTESPGNLVDSYDQLYKLSPEQQEECRKRERGVRRFHHEGKSCLERYRIASMRIFAIVLESLTKRLGGRNQFVLERASIDEFYLDITRYCYNTVDKPMEEHKTLVLNNQLNGENGLCNDSKDEIYMALQRACLVSHWVRQDVWSQLGFTLSAGISTNKVMAKLAASYGKPDGQAILHPQFFDTVLHKTKITKVRHFGGKLGRKVLKLLEQTNSHGADVDNATMGDLQPVPLPVLQKHFSPETAQFIFDSSRGIDREAVKETAGALVKSITCFKTFPATLNQEEIQNWLSLLAEEVTIRVGRDTARNHRYPRTCTLNYSYYSTPSGKRPDGASRSQFHSRSLRLNYPKVHSKNAQQDLVQQGMQKLLPLLSQFGVRGLGFAVGNFEAHGQAPDGETDIKQFFKKEGATSVPSSDSKPPESLKRKHDDTSAGEAPARASTPDQTDRQSAVSVKDSTQVTPNTGLAGTLPSTPKTSTDKEAPLLLDKDMELAKKLQASFDREHYVLSTSNRFKGAAPTPAKSRRIDSFFAKG